MSSTNITTLNPLAASMQAAEQDPLYGRVYRILNTDRLGAWGDAIDIYSEIRRGFIWEELITLTAGKATPETKAKAEVLLDELRGRLTGVLDMLPRAEAMVKTWATPAPAKPKTKAAQPKSKLARNAFAALGEDNE